MTLLFDLFKRKVCSEITSNNLMLDFIMYIYICICLLYIFLCVLFIYVFIHLFIYLSIYLFIYLFIFLFIDLFIFYLYSMVPFDACFLFGCRQLFCWL